MTKRVKRALAALLLAALLLPLAACGESKDLFLARKGEPRIAVLAAMNMEAKQLEKLLEEPERFKHDGKSFVHGGMGGAHVILHQGGMGLDKAEAGAKALIESFQPDILILFGMSGGIVPDVALYETVVAQTVYAAWDFDIPAIATDETLVTIATEVLPHARAAAIATGGKMTWTKKSYDLISGTCGAVAVDQESYAVAKAAREANVPLLIIRSMSDTYDTTSLLGFFKYGPISAEKAAMDTETVIKKLGEQAG